PASLPRPPAAETARREPPRGGVRGSLPAPAHRPRVGPDPHAALGRGGRAGGAGGGADPSQLVGGARRGARGAPRRRPRHPAAGRRPRGSGEPSLRPGPARRRLVVRLSRSTPRGSRRGGRRQRASSPPDRRPPAPPRTRAARSGPPPG